MASVLPTRTPGELRRFQEHCWGIYQLNEDLHVVYDQNIRRLHEYSTSPLHFVDLLWRSRTNLSLGGITEYYCWIRRQRRPHNTSRAILEPAFQVTYSWNEYKYTVTRLTQHPRI